MAKLYKYPLSGFWSNIGDFGQMIPIYYGEVLPGQSMHGSARVKIVTDSLVKIALNRMWFDMFFFYVPNRLLWSGWETFIVGGGGTVPTVGDDWEFNFEKRLPVGAGTARAAWRRYCYNFVWNNALRSHDQAEVALSQTTPQEVLNRARSFQNQLMKDALPDETIDVSGGTLDLQELKEAQKEYRRKRIEYFFQGPSGKEYLSMLENMGVRPGWEIDDSPRLIGQYHVQATFETVVGTAATNVASPSGFWAGHAEVKFGSKFFPEHGVILGVCVPRMEFAHEVAGRVHPLDQKTELSYFYTDGQRPSPPNTWSAYHAGHLATTQVQNAPAWEDYRSSVSQMFGGFYSAGAPWDDNYFIIAKADTSGDAWKLRSYGLQVEPDNNDFFRNFVGEGKVALASEISGVQMNPVPPRQVNI